MWTNNREKGRITEDVARTYLLKSGYKVLDRNWTCYAGEIDLVVFKHGLIFVEVKSVTNGNFIKPHELFHYKKRKNLLRSVNSYLASKMWSGKKWKMDLICIVRETKSFKLTHYKNVTDLLLQ